MTVTVDWELKKTQFSKLHNSAKRSHKIPNFLSKHQYSKMCAENSALILLGCITCTQCIDAYYCNLCSTVCAYKTAELIEVLFLV